MTEGLMCNNLAMYIEKRAKDAFGLGLHLLLDSVGKYSRKLAE